MRFSTQTIAAGQTGDPIVLRGTATVALICTDSAKLQYTVSESLGAANWLDWPYGVVTASRAEPVISVHAVRCVNSGAASATLEVAHDA